MKNNHIVKIAMGEFTPDHIPANTNRIISSLGSYWRGIETKDFVYFCNYQEGDENANVKMFRKMEGDTLELASDNYFAHGAMFEDIMNKNYTYLSKSMKFNAKEMQKEEIML